MNKLGFFGELDLSVCESAESPKLTASSLRASVQKRREEREREKKETQSGREREGVGRRSMWSCDLLSL